MLSRRLLGLVQLAHGAIVRTALLGLVITGTYVGQGLVVAGVLAQVLDGQGTATIAALAAAFVVLQAVRVGLLGWRERIGTDAAAAVKADVRRRIYAKVARLGPAYTVGERTGMLQTTLVDSVDRLDRYVAAFLPLVGSSLLGALGIAAAVAAVDVWVGTIVAVTAVVVLVAPLLTRRLVDRAMRAWTAEYRQLYSDSLDAIQGMATLKAFAAHQRREADLRQQGERFAKASTRLVAASTVYEGALGVASAVGMTVSVVVGSFPLPQDTYLFHGTLRDNLRLGRPDAQLLAAATAARADDGLDTVVGERGATLSGGQRQRIALARAILRDSPILILDEPVSNLDAETEAELAGALASARQGRTVVVIAHRLSTIRTADRVVMLDHGRLSQTGTHEALVANGGPYHRLTASQLIA